MGCTTAAAPPSTAPATQPATRPATTARAAAAEPLLKLSDAVVIDTTQHTDVEIDLTSKFQPPQSRGVIYLGTLSTPNDDQGAIAIIGTRSGEAIKAIPIPDQRLSDAQWVYAGAGPALGELWGALDDASDPPAADLLLVHSTDGGQTWTVTGLHKPTDQADFSEFQMDHTGHGRVTLYVGADVADDEPRPGAAGGRPRKGRQRRPRREPVRAGYYHFRTTDGGKTWVLQPELDAMTPAGDVPEEEQPVGHTLVKRLVHPTGAGNR